MPYGFKKSLGGDNASNDARMEACVTRVVAKGHDKVTAIRICKAAIQKAVASGR